MLRGTSVFLAALLVTSTACAHHHGTQSVNPASAPVRVHVMNNHTMQLDVWAVIPGVSRRLGTVGPGLSKSFIVPPALVQDGPVEIQVQGVGGAAPLSTTDLTLLPGDVVDVTITAQFELTFTISHY